MNPLFVAELNAVLDDWNSGEISREDAQHYLLAWQTELNANRLGWLLCGCSQCRGNRDRHIQALLDPPMEGPNGDHQ